VPIDALSSIMAASSDHDRFGAARCANRADVELITADYVTWYNQQRLMHRLGRIPPAEAEAEYYEQLDASPSLYARDSRKSPVENPDAGGALTPRCCTKS
jgi:hypothetical protein